MKLNLETLKQNAKLAKSNERYNIYDLKLEHLVLSLTELHPNQETRGHEHSDVEEVYYFLSGSGKMKLGEEEFEVKKDDIVTIPLGEFHKISNTSGEEELSFLCIFEKYERE